MKLVAAALLAGAVLLRSTSPQSLTSIYADVPSQQCVASTDLLLKIEDAPVPIARATPGPHPISVVLLFDISPSMPPVGVDVVARRLSAAAQPRDRFRLATFGPKILLSTTVAVDERAASRAAREVAQASDSERGPSPLWDAIHESVAVRAPESVHVVVVFTDARSTGNDRSYAEVYDEVTGTGTVVVAVGVGDNALPRNSHMLVVGRNAALRKLAVDSAGDYTEITKPRQAPPLGFLADSLGNIRHRCRLDFAPPVGGVTPKRLSLTAAGIAVRAPVRVPNR